MEENENRSGRGTLWAVLLALCFPILYVLSVGPAVVIVKHAGGMEVARRIYAPLLWLRENTPLRAPLDAYVDLWDR